MDKPRRSRTKFVAALTLIGVLAGAVVAAASAATGGIACRGGSAEECLDLARTLALRVGLVTGLVTVLMLLLVAGLLRMVVQDEERRLTMKRESGGR